MNAGPTQAAVAAAMGQVGEKTNPAFIIALGDNFYFQVGPFFSPAFFWLEEVSEVKSLPTSDMLLPAGGQEQERSPVADRLAKSIHGAFSSDPVVCYLGQS